MALFDFLKTKEETERKKAKHAPVVSDDPKVKKETKVADPIFEASADTMVLVKPHITEKSRDIASTGAFVFEVREDATKYTVKQSVEQLYNVHVTGVRMVNIPTKPRRRGLTSGRKGGYKKAIVSLRKGETIELF